MDKYYVSSNLPECFRAADEYMAKKYPQKKIIRRSSEKPIVVPMPDIQSSKTINGPLGLTEEFYIKEKTKQNKRNAQLKENIENELIRMLGKKDMLKKQLNKLDIGKRKDAKRITSINIEIKRLERNIKMLESESGIKIGELQKGSKVGRFIERAKIKVKKCFKKVKKFFKRNSETILGVLAVAIPSIISIFYKNKSKPAEV